MKKYIGSKAPKLVIVSEGIRRDLHQPLRYFRKITVFHLYKKASYGDMMPTDFYNPRAEKFQSALELYKKIKAIKPDILQTAEPWANKISFVITLVCYWYSLWHSTVLIFPVFENRPFDKKFSKIQNKIICQWGKILASRSQLIFYMNQGAYKNLQKMKISDAKTMRANWGTWGIDFNDFNTRGVQKTWDRLYEPVIFFAGKISRAKGVPWLLDAFAKLKNDFPQAKLKLAGPLDEEDFLKKIKTTRGAQYIVIIKNQELAIHFQKATLTVSPSITTPKWEEQVGMVNLQSMACGTPVVSTYSGAIPEYICDRNGCLLVAEKNSDEIYRAIKKMIGDRVFYARQVEKAKQWVKRYEVQENIIGIEKILIKLIYETQS